MTTLSIPPEVLQDIVELAAYSSYRQAATLARVCHAFNDWVRPVLFRVFKRYSYHNNFPLPPTLDLPWFQTNGKYIRHLLWGENFELLVNSLKFCPNIQDLAIWVDTDKHNVARLFSAFSQLHLHRLSINLLALYSCEKFTVEHAQDPVFSDLTHLDLILNSTVTWDEIAGIAELPCLTHLTMTHGIATSVVESAAKHCQKLQVIILAAPAGAFGKNDDLNGEMTVEIPWDSGEFEDPRVVSFQCEYVGDWELAATGKQDLWTKAEDIVAKRSGLENF